MLKLLALAALLTGIQDSPKVETSFAVPKPVPPTEEQGVAVQVLNGFRALHGLDAVTLDPRLVSSAESHSRTMAKSRFLTHKEEDSAMADASSRSRAFGFVGPIAELVASGMPNVPYSVATFMDAPYHRRHLLRPGKLQFGCAETDGYVCLVLGGASTRGAVVSPPDGAQGVPTAWDGIEEPNPVRTKGAKPPYGYPVAFFAFGSSLKHVRASLTDGSGKTVAVFLNEPANDPNSPDSVILIPKAPLKQGTRYTASFESEVDGHRSTRTHTFTTGTE